MRSAAVGAGSRSTTRAPCRPRILALGRHRAGLPRSEAAADGGRRLDQRDAQAVRIDDRQDALAEPRLDGGDGGAVAGQPRGPPVQGARRYGERHLGGESVSVAGGRHVGPREERQIGAGVALGVRVEEVERAGIVLVDAALDEAHAEDAGVEVEVLLGRPGDRRHVMQTVDRAHTRQAIRSGSRSGSRCSSRSGFRSLFRSFRRRASQMMQKMSTSSNTRDSVFVRICSDAGQLDGRRCGLHRRVDERLASCGSPPHERQIALRLHLVDEVGPAFRPRYRPIG